jgi:hypothetical protein
MRNIRAEDVPQLQAMSVAHACPNTSLEFWHLMVSDFAEHCFVVEQTATPTSIVGFVVATDTRILQLAVGWKHKRQQYWLLRRCIESFERETLLKFRVLKEDALAMSRDLAKLDFIEVGQHEKFVDYTCKRGPLRFVCGTCDNHEPVCSVSTLQQNVWSLHF